MGYLDNTSITVDAVLTKKGREILKDGGNLNIKSFTLSDTGVDYTLYNTSHPSGSAFYGEAIENLPMLEASVHAEYNLRNRLFTLNQNTIAMPALVVSGVDTSGGRVVTFKETEKGFTGTALITVKLVGYPEDTGGYYAIVQDPQVVTVTGTGVTETPGTMSGTGMAGLLVEQDIPMARRYDFAGPSFTLTAQQVNKDNRKTTVTIVQKETGAMFSLEVINSILKDPRNLLSTPRTGNAGF